MKILYITCKNEEEAKYLANKCVKNKLAACGNIFSISSIYEWNNEIQNDDEMVLILKTDESKVNELKNKVKELHSYEIPCILELDAKANKEYYNWIKSCLGSQK